MYALEWAEGWGGVEGGVKVYFRSVRKYATVFI